uniref:Alkylated DNA repair protein alkB 8 putative n=1 Tax=Albugo laibachii Nc14 TaxID=890382 RepID=F0W5H8_9STRA|nr:alkylated DNA repair protein alkB 8 putative [Albugo laibachii Nc14]|eukprot:CCA16369.1 alkylated DNA repair protein alkB 8 putative [Albugo laibachii Nc14]
MAAAANAKFCLSDFVEDDAPSRFLRCTMSRSVKMEWIAKEKLLPFLHTILTHYSQTNLDYECSKDSILGIYYGIRGRRTLLIELANIDSAKVIKECVHGKPCSILHQRVLYAAYSIHRKDKEERDCLNSVQNVTRDIALDPDNRIPGLILLPDFISEAQEQELVAFLDGNDKSRWKDTIRARQVQHYGYEFNYDTRRCDEEMPLDSCLPPILRTLAEKIPLSIPMDQAAEMGMIKFGDDSEEHLPVPFDQVTANEYLPGQGIAPHIDTHSAFTGAIVSLSLEGETVMEFTHPDGRRDAILLQPRSLLILSGASRYEWRHGIASRAFDIIDHEKTHRRRRVSITFRKVQTTPCTCDYPYQCDRTLADDLHRVKLGEADDINKKIQPSSTSRAPSTVEKAYVHDFYDRIADHFDSTRYAPWPKVASFVESLPEGAIIADVGCGNGKYMKIIDGARRFIFGGDRSSKLVNICSTQGLKALVLDALSVPIRSDSCDAALSIAVLHHLSSLEHRIMAVRELIRILRVGKEGIIYAWAHEQQDTSRRHFDPNKQDFMVPWNLDRRYVKDDCKEKGNVVVQRFCHMFREGELQALVELAGNARVESSYYDNSNWAIVFRKVS